MAEPVPAAGVASRRWWDLTPKELNIVAVTLLFLTTLPMLTKIFTSDFGTHIALGRQIVQTRSIADKEFLNYPSLGQSQPNPVWLFQTILYIVFSLGGVYAVSFLLWGITFVIFLFLHRAMVLRGAHPLLAVAALFAFSGFLRIRIQPRPEIFTYFFIALTIWLLTEYYYGKRKRAIWAFPPLMLVWANTHASYLVAFVLAAAFLVDRFARAAWNRELGWESLKKWVFLPIGTGLLGLALVGLNPNGYSTILTPIQMITRGAVGGGGPDSVSMSISELTPVKGTGMFVYYKAAVLFAGVSLLLGALGRRVYLLDLLFFAIAFKGAWESARAVSMMGLFLAPGISIQLTGFLGKVREWSAEREGLERAKREKERAKAKGSGRGGGKRSAFAEPPLARGGAPGIPSFRWVRATAASVAVLLCLAFGGTNLVFSFSQLEYGVGITEHKFSFAAGEFLRKNLPRGKMFNFFDIGGFLDWQVYPQAMTFLDGRTYNQQVFMEHQIVTGAMPGWEGILRKYGVTYIVLKSMDSSGMILPIVPALANDTNWTLVFSDGLFVVFVREGPENREIVEKFRIPKGALPQHIIREAYHYMYLGISPVVAYQTMSNMYMILGDRAAAAQMVRRALEEVDDPMLRARLSQIEQGGTPPRPHP
ncbi:MAG: hypothetical protein ACXWWV_12585 [Candidatus Deferrimicrobiaceae bacterium]